MTVEHHESAKNIKENVLKNFREELGHLKDVVPQQKNSVSKEKPVWTNVPTEAVNDIKNQIKEVVGTEEVKKIEKKVEVAKKIAKQLIPYTGNRTKYLEDMEKAIEENKTLTDLFKEINNQFQDQLGYEINLDTNKYYS